MLCRVREVIAHLPSVRLSLSASSLQHAGRREDSKNARAEPRFSYRSAWQEELRLADDAESECLGDSLGSAAYLELLEDVGDVEPHGSL